MIREPLIFPVTDNAGRSLVNNRYAAVDAYPGEHCRFTDVSFRPAAKFTLVPGECRQFGQFSKVDGLEPASCLSVSKRGAVGNASGQFRGYLGQEKGLVACDGHLQRVCAPSASIVAQCRGVEDEVGHSPLSNSPRSSSSDIESGSGRSASPTEKCSSSMVLADVNCPFR
jgi:hypothetical protein